MWEGFAGDLADLLPGLTRGYASASTDTGHRGSDAAGSPTRDGSWARGDVQKQIDWGHRGTHAATVAAKALTRDHYGTPARYAIFEGCSNGGRQGLMEAQRYPDDYDGILAHAPAVSTVDMFRTWIWQVQTQLRNDDAWLSPDDLSAISTVTLAASERAGFAADDLVIEPAPFSDGHRRALLDEGFDERKLGTLEAIYGGGSAAEADRMVGHEEGWEPFITGSAPPVARPDGRWTFPDGPEAPAAYTLTNEFLRYFVFDDPTYDLVDFDLSQDGDQLEPYREILDATDPDLTAFVDRGGKLLVTHGWADPALNPLDTVAYVEEATEVLGTSAGSALRLYLIPGMFHCAGGPGLTNVDALSALEAWVREGVTPQELTVADDDGRSAPLCPYPVRLEAASDEAAEPWRCAADGE